MKLPAGRLRLLPGVPVNAGGLVVLLDQALVQMLPHWLPDLLR